MKVFSFSYMKTRVCCSLLLASTCILSSCASVSSAGFASQKAASAVMIFANALPAQNTNHQSTESSAIAIKQLSYETTPLQTLASSSSTYSQNGVVIDTSAAANGYVQIKYTGAEKKLKVQVKKDSSTYNYDLNGKGITETYSLQMGNGQYSIRVLENVSGYYYKELYSIPLAVTLSSETAPFLYPNQYVSYSSSSLAAKKAAELSAGASTDVEKLKLIYNYMIKNIKYDFDKAAKVTSGYVPNVDSILTSQKGICFDYSSLMAAMLRSQGIPSKVVVGSVDTLAVTHAWNEVYLKGTGWITIKIEVSNTGWKLMDPTLGASNTVGKGYTTVRIY